MHRKIIFPVAATVAYLLVAQASPAFGQTNEPGASTSIHRSRKGLVIAGAVTFGVSYGIATALGAWVGTHHTSDCAACGTTAALFAIPVAGPWVAEASSPRPSAIWPWAAWSGVEAAGVALLIVGLVGHDVPREPSPPVVAHVSLVPTFTPGLSALSLHVIW